MTAPATYAVPSTFLAVTRHDREAPICVAGVPLDLGTTNRSGARFGPSAIRQASRMLTDGAHPQSFVDPAALPLADIGDFNIALGDLMGSLARIEAQARDIAHLVALGGDHGITLPLLRALKGRRGAPALIHFDAHVDTWPESFGQAFAHGSVFYHAITEGLVDPRRMVQVGIRSPLARAVHDWTAQGVTIMAASNSRARRPRSRRASARSWRCTSLSELRYRVCSIRPLRPHRDARDRRACELAGGGDPAAPQGTSLRRLDGSRSRYPMTSPRSRRSPAPPGVGEYLCFTVQGRPLWAPSRARSHAERGRPPESMPVFEQGRPYGLPRISFGSMFANKFQAARKP